MTTPRARVRTFRGWPAVTLTAGDLEATFLPGLGMLGVSLRHRGREHLSLHGGLEAYAEGHTTGLPLLAPWANRLAGFEYRIGRRVVRFGAGTPGVQLDPNGLPIHGTVSARPWELVELSASAAAAALAARFPFGDHQDLLRCFPFPHDLRIDALVTRERLRVTTSVVPTGRRAVPVSFGWHPYLRLPGVPRRELVVHLPARRHLELDERMLPTGRARREPAERIPLAGRTLDEGYRLGRERVLALSGRGQCLELRLDRGYPYAQVYAPRGKPYVALEPMTAPTNALVTGDHPTVPAGGCFSATFDVVVGREPRP